MSKEESKKKKVIIKWLAYSKMMKHVLRFGSNAKDKSQYKEVMGVLIGHLVDEPGIIKDVIIEDVVPISHGGHVEVAFKPEDYGSFSVVDYAYSEQKWFSVGWYHSHPGLTCFFSAVDVRNQMGWQGPNPSAVGIVWDHTRLGGDDGDMGFDVYRLDDPQNAMSEYHEVQWVVEPPDSVKFFKNGIVDLITNIQKGEPPILELNEVPDVFGDLTVPGQSAMMSKEPELNYSEVTESLKGGIEKMSDIFIQPLIRYLNEWARGMTQGIINKNVIMLSNIKGLKDNLSKAMASLQSWFKFALNDSLRNVDIYIDDKFEFNEEQRKMMSQKLEELSESLNKSLSDAFDSALGNILKNTTEQMGSATETLKKITETSEEIENLIVSQNKLIETSVNSYKEKMGEIKTNGNLILADSVRSLKDGLQPVTGDIESLQKQMDDIKMSLKAIIGMVKGGN